MPELAARLEHLNTVFGVELADRTRTLHLLLQSLDGGADDVALGQLARSLHSLKGAARAVGARSIEQVAHSAEGAVVTLRRGTRPDHVWFAALNAAIDSLPALALAPAIDISPIIAALAAVSPELPQPIHIHAPRTPSPHAPTTLVAAPDRNEPGSVRVSLTKLDALLTESGELSVTHLRISERLKNLRDVQRQLERWQREWSKTRPARARLRRAQTHLVGPESEALFRVVAQSDDEIHSILQRTRELVGDLSQNIAQLAAVAGAISQEVLAIRLLPAGTVFAPLERLVRDLSKQTGKDVRLQLSGGDTEIDRRILDELRDPLMHMVRNTVDHGIELPQDRLQAGKLAHGTLRVSAVQRGDRVQISVEDDGRGLDVEAIRLTALRKNMLSVERAEHTDSAGFIELIFAPGFSTRTKVDELSGRGVGMDVVRDHVNRLGGDINVRTAAGTGTCFTITVPLTLATTRVLLVGDGSQIYAVPSSSIERTGRVRVSDVRRLEGRLAAHIDGRAVPVVELREVLHRMDATAIPATDEWRPFVVLNQGDRAVALLTDQLIDETELVVKALGAPLMRVRHVGGAAVLGTGAVVVILNPGDLIKSALGNIEAARPSGNAEEHAPQTAAARQRILVVDDSVMTRTLERTILEAAGYSVVVANDGVQALEMLDAHAIDAIVSDIEMPRLDGFALTAAVRANERWHNLPIVLVTSLDAPEQVERGGTAGADAYIVKGRFDQNDLLQTLGRLL